MKKHQKITTKPFSLILLAILAVVSPCPVLATAPVGFGVDRSVVMIRIEGGKELPFFFNVTNNTGSGQIVHLEEKDILIGDENVVSFPDMKGGPSTWVTFQRNDFTLADGESELVDASVKIPAGHENGAKMMTMVYFFSTGDAPESGPKISGTIGIYTILSGQDTHNASGMIEKFSFPKYIRDCKDASVSYVNNGDVQFVPQGKMTITNLATRKETEITFENRFVFPGKKITFTKNVPQCSLFGIYKLNASFGDGNGKFQEKTIFAVGKYFPIIFSAFLVFLFLLLNAYGNRKKTSNQKRL